LKLGFEYRILNPWDILFPKALLSVSLKSNIAIQTLDSRRKQLNLKVVIFKTRHGYVAECLDLDISVREKTERLALRSLTHAVAAHLAVAVQGDMKGLIPRPAPWSHYVRYYGFVLLSKVVPITAYAGERPFPAPLRDLPSATVVPFICS
jgi:hypothetical protein